MFLFILSTREPGIRGQDGGKEADRETERKRTKELHGKETMRDDNILHCGRSNDRFPLLTCLCVCMCAYRCCCRCSSKRACRKQWIREPFLPECTMHTKTMGAKNGRAAHFFRLPFPFRTCPSFSSCLQAYFHRRYRRFSLRLLSVDIFFFSSSCMCVCIRLSWFQIISSFTFLFFLPQQQRKRTCMVTDDDDSETAWRNILCRRNRYTHLVIKVYNNEDGRINSR